MNSITYEANAYMHNFEFANHLAPIVCLMSDKKWVQRKKYPNNVCLPYKLQIFALRKGSPLPTVFNPTFT